MFKWPGLIAALSLAIAVGLGPASGNSREIEIIMALPAQTLTFSTAFVAEDAGFYRNEGLKVSHRFLVGVTSPNAVIAGSAMMISISRLLPEAGPSPTAIARESAATSPGCLNIACSRSIVVF